jgi:hypothetical protein
MERSDWPANDPLMIAYHDEEWGVPVHDDHKHFEFMVLDAFQYGLSWSVVLKKRRGFQIHRIHHFLGLHAGCRNGERPSDALFQIPRTPVKESDSNGNFRWIWYCCL